MFYKKPLPNTIHEIYASGNTIHYPIHAHNTHY